MGCGKKKFRNTPLVNNPVQGYSPEISDENFVVCNPKYKKPIELDILFNSK
jgi:hypothetical protein